MHIQIFNEVQEVEETGKVLHDISVDQKQKISFVFMYQSKQTWNNQSAFSRYKIMCGCCSI